MKVDRSLFHVLVGALATGAVACVVKEYQPPPPPPPAPPPPVANNTPPPPAPGQPLHLQPIHETNTKGQPAPAPAPGPPHFSPIRPGPGPAPAPSPSPSPSSCLDSSGGLTAICNMQSCSSNPFPKARCGNYATYFDPKVATTAIACMNNLSGANACDSQHAYDCGKAALAQACPDSTVNQLCQIAVNACKASQSDCVAMFSGLNSTGQDAVAQCVAGGCNGGNLYSCIEGLH